MVLPALCCQVVYALSVSSGCTAPGDQKEKSKETEKRRMESRETSTPKNHKTKRERNLAESGSLKRTKNRADLELNTN